ncbi:MAG: alpha/beta hydrolase [Acholeplasmataceae bacterium]|jgi:pimeloyl-ACP methyl ester carboxylesterase|nr:alpha/beta hydrolase [Acholeplasmataceae bacterium]
MVEGMKPMTLLEQYVSFTKEYSKKSFHYRGDVINYRLFGTGDKVVVFLVGSSMFTSEAYFQLQEELSKHVQVLTIEDFSMKISIQRIIHCLSYLIKMLGFNKVILFGMSHGGGLAQAFARDYASQTEGIILYNTLTRPKKHNDVSKAAIEGILKSIIELKELRRILPLKSIKQVLLDQIESKLDSEDDFELFQLLISKYTESDEREQMEIIRDLLTNYIFDRRDFKYLNYRSLIFYGYDEDPFGGTDLIESLVDMMTNPVLRFIETDRYQLILNPMPIADAIIEFLKL